MSHTKPSPYYATQPKITEPDKECPPGVKESPDIRLTKFIKSTEIVHPGQGLPPPQKILKEIMNDERWTRRMLEDWFKKGPPSQTLALTPNPEFRAIYLVLLSILEETGREKSGLGVVSQKQRPLTFEEEKVEEEKLRGRIADWTVEHEKWKNSRGARWEEQARAKEEKAEESGEPKREFI